jgi:cell division protein ZapA
MDRRTIDLRIAGQNYRLMSSASEEDLRRLAGLVNAKVAEVAPRGKPQPAQAVLLAAMALAHELEAERGQRKQLEHRTRELLRGVLGRIDDALRTAEPESDHAPPDASA